MAHLPIGSPLWPAAFFGGSPVGFSQQTTIKAWIRGLKLEDAMAYGNNTLLNHYLAGDDFEDIAKICGITIEQVREYMSMKTSEDVRLNQRADRTLYGRRLIARLERGLADGPWGEG